MSVLQLTQYQGADSKILPQVDTSSSVVVGVDIQDSSRIQLIRDASEDMSTPMEQFGLAQTILRLQLQTTAASVLRPGTLAAAPVVEYARSFFESSQVTPQFQAKIEADFARFNDIYMPGTSGELGHFTAWTIDEQEHEGKPTRSFILVRGWKSMADFQRSIETEQYRQAIPILFAWGAPFEMRHLRTYS